MSRNVIPWPKPAVRAIVVERVKPRSPLWHAHFTGDEWTREKIFNPPMRLALLLAELQECPARDGLPIIIRREPREMAA